MLEGITVLHRDQTGRVEASMVVQPFVVTGPKGSGRVTYEDLRKDAKRLPPSKRFGRAERMM